MKKGIIVLSVLFTLILVASCGSNSTSKSEDKDCCTQTATKSEADCGNDCSSCTTSCSMESAVATEAGTVEVLYMHGKQRCVTCIAIGTESEAVIKELANDKVVMKTIDFSTPEGEKIADKYEIASSSLIVVKDDKVENLTAIGFQYARNNPEQFRKSLSETIQKMLK